VIAALLAAITFAAEPPRVQLGETGRVHLRIAAPAGLRLSASTGRIEGLRESSPGNWTADYLPPEESIPQIAIVAALSGAEVGFLALPLWGQGDAVVRTRAGARIEVEIGDQRFGPAVADSTGTAVVPVDVPPGVHAARHGRELIDLHVPVSRTVHVVLDREAAAADHEEHVRALLFAVTADGKPRTDARFEVHASRGTAGDPSARSPGIYELDWTVPAGAAGSTSISAALADAPQLIAQAALRLEAGVAASLKLDADRARAVAGAGGFSVRATSRDAAGNPSSELLRFETTLGTVTASGGEARIELPSSFAGATDVRVTVRPKNREQPFAQLSLPLAAAEPASARIDLPAQRAFADGQSPVRLRLRIADRFGNPVADARPMVAVDAGTLGAAQPAGGGAYETSWVPPVSREHTQASVAVSAGAAEGRAQLDLLPRVPRLALGVRAGALSNFSGLNSPVAGVEAAWRTNRWGPELALSADVTYALQNAGAATTSVGAHTHTDYLTTAIGLSWRIAVAPGVRCWVGAGPLLEAVFSRSTLAGSQQNAATMVLGFHASAGVEKRMGNGAPFAELRASTTNDPALSNLSGSLSAFALSLGYRFELL
jgi:hypothetical protein